MDEGTLRNTISRVKLLNTFVKPPPKLRRKRHSAGKQKAVQQKDFEYSKLFPMFPPATKIIACLWKCR